ncbi:multicopper oxidase [Zopfia rhizophila CBS 207.26]|uniref:Multicopper oxidase n=1 Tax=Zopfia rhizophila CBS 207.26 TaxID=1314779 RepID=A0A6A6DWF5_9PEZI|nr:multicopper oxidase [Zopfia rhizophila CBS 207.26]
MDRITFTLFLFVGTVLAVLPQVVTNGKSLLGTLDAPRLNCCVNDECKPGKTRFYDFTITRGYLSPDGVNTSTILVNGAFPGPTLEANLGDTFEIRVTNQIDGPEAGTALHWHGLFQKGTPWMDGVPSVTMCPIAPGSTFTYRFKADRAGSSWWHSHYSAQTAGGLFGAMIIHDPNAKPQYDIDIGPVLLSDRYHIDYRDLVNGTVNAVLIYSDNNLINGKMNFDCSKVKDGKACTPNAGISKFRFESGKKHLLRLINSGAEALQHFTIDQHKMTVTALDYVSVKPFTTDVIHLSPGQRADVVVEATGKSGDSFWMRSDVDPNCSGSTQPHALAAIYYDNADTNADPKSTATNYTAVGCVTTTLEETVPLEIAAPPESPSFTQNIDFTLGYNSTGWLQYFTNNNQFRADYGQSLLLSNQGGSPKSQNTTASSFQAPALSNLFDFGKNTTVRMVIRNYFISPHPMHLHGHDFWILAEGRGEWDGKVTNPANPMRRDTHQMLGMVDNQPGYIIIEFALDNPGVWAFHCHISLHLILGMYMNIVYRTEDIQKYQIPNQIADGCSTWREYANTTYVEQPDSGLRR